MVVVFEPNFLSAGRQSFISGSSGGRLPWRRLTQSRQRADWSVARLLDVIDFYFTFLCADDVILFESVEFVKNFKFVHLFLKKFELSNSIQRKLGT